MQYFKKYLWKKIAARTEADFALQKMISCIANGWKKDCLNQYYHYREELTVIKCIVLKGRHVIVAKSLQQEMLKIIHEGHLEVEKCKRHARRVLYWLNMNNDIEELASRLRNLQHTPVITNKRTHHATSHTIKTLVETGSRSFQCEWTRIPTRD